tara:strand:- start:308 stop:460 length:153 start_codon:yes stop_codon:yes gene_type:complete
MGGVLGTTGDCIIAINAINTKPLFLIENTPLFKKALNTAINKGTKKNNLK